jgi:protease-4
MEAIVDDTYEDIVATLAADRGLADYEVKTLLDQGLFTAAAAKKARLIDRVAYADELETALCKRLRAESLNVVADYKKKKVDTDFSGVTGMMKFMELLMGGKPSQAASTRQKVAVVYAVGPIMQGKSVADLFGSQVLGSTTLVAALRQAADDPKVVAIVLRIDSPGGSAVASDLIWREVVRIKKPIIASMGDVAGSGGYYIAMGANRIFAEPGTLTGSIGVIGGKPVVGGLYEKIGLTTETISRGKNSGSFSTTEPFTPEQRKAWTALLQETYRQFVGKAAQGRKLAVDELEKLAQGRVYTGRMAVANGLVDELGTLGDAISAAKKAAGLSPDEKVELLILPRPKTIFEQLFGNEDDSATLASLSAVWQAALPASALSASLKDAPPGLSAALRQATLMRRLFAEPSLLWMPYRVEMK